MRRLPGAPAAVLENVKRGVFLIPYHLTDAAPRVKKLIDNYADVPMDLADACLVDMATEVRSGRILTLDGHFRIYRWGRNRPFELLIDLKQL